MTFKWDLRYRMQPVFNSLYHSLKFLSSGLILYALILLKSLKSTSHDISEMVKFTISY
jgi:hypothetical protein